MSATGDLAELPRTVIVYDVALDKYLIGLLVVTADPDSVLAVAVDDVAGDRGVDAARQLDAIAVVTA